MLQGPSRFVICLFSAGITAFIIWIVFNAQFALPPKPPASLFLKFLQGQYPAHPPGFEFAPFKPLLPRDQPISMIMDYPYDVSLAPPGEYPKLQNTFNAALSYLAPLNLSYRSGAKAAIIFCSNSEIADRRLRETGYRLLRPLAPGKGIALKVK